MGLSSDEDELNVVDSNDDEATPRKIKSVGSSVTHADRSDLSTTPQSNDESQNINPSSMMERSRRQIESGVKRSRTQKRHLNDNAVMEKRLIEKLTQENQRLKIELESRHHRFNGLPQQSVIVSSGSTQPTTTPLIHPTPASNPLPFFGFPPAQISQPPPTPQIQSSGSAFSVPQQASSSRPLEQQLDPATLSLFYSPFANNPQSFLSLFGSNPSGNQFMGPNDLTSFNGLQAILQQQQQNQQSLFPNFSSSSATTTNASSSNNPATTSAPFSQLIQTDPLLSIFQQNNQSAFSNFRNLAPTTNTTDSNQQQQDQNMRFSALFQPANPVPEPTTNGPGSSKKLNNGGKQHKSRKNGPSPESSGSQAEQKVVTRGPGNIQFVNQLPTAQEPRASVLVHTDESQPKSTSWLSPTTRKSPQQKRDKNSPRSSSAFSALPDHSSTSTSCSNQQFNSAANVERPQSLLGSLLSTSSSSRRSPSVPESRTEKQSGLVEQQRGDQDRFKSCLTSLAVNLSTSSANNQPTVGCSRSDNDSMGSPHSTRSTTDSNRSQISPPLGQNLQESSSNAHTSTTEGPSDGRLEHERYMDRRRRNNEAAKRCRANRRAIFEYRSRRAQQLEAENTDLRQEMLKLNSELEQLKAVIASSNNRLLTT